MPWRNSSGGTCSPMYCPGSIWVWPFAADSGALALRFFKESPLLLGLLEPAQRQVVLTAGLELADRQANVAVEFMRIAPEVIRVLPPEDWPTGWTWPVN